MQIHHSAAKFSPQSGEESKSVACIKNPCFLLNSERLTDKSNRPQNFDKIIHLSTIRL